MKTSETLGELAVALAAAQGEMKIASKDNTNTFFAKGANKSKYADINNVWLACREALSKHNLAVIQSPSSTPDRCLRMTTRIIHKSGEWIEDEIDFKPREDTPQAFGSCVTYARRYTLGSMVGVIAEDLEDDDGNAASIAPKKLKEKEAADAAAAANQVYSGTGPQQEILIRLAIKAGVTHPQAQARIHKAVMGKPMANIEGHVFEAIQALDEQGK